ncbi:unnamed protein product [Mesocestoides corti]|uniref:Rho-GAP domain-containing protein n=1 Tax=Mesocestoides corti TaxID=53468 RepID=A0A0R3UI43_MESCO|nr:unnamed protein product [Mesocestoides corti]
MPGKHVRRPRSKPPPLIMRYIPPSEALLDHTPTAPTADDPHQRVIGKIDRSALTLYLQILASSDYLMPNAASDTGHPPQDSITKSPGSKPARTRMLGDRMRLTGKRQTIEYFDGPGHDESRLSEEVCFNRALANGVSEVVRDALLKRELSLADFRPLKAPFVPNILKALVNFIEADCRKLGWGSVFTSHPHLRETAELHACLLIQNWNHRHHAKRQIAALSLPMKVATLRTLLGGFKQKPLHFNKKVLQEVIKRPLFDQFLRPNPDIKSLVRHTALPCNRTTMDTLAFMMFHLQHAWECGNNPIVAKIKLAKLYGPLLVSFSERPVIIDQDPTDYKTEEAAILEVVLEVCNKQFWDNLSMLKMHLAFVSPTTPEDGRPDAVKGGQTHEKYHGLDTSEGVCTKTPSEASDYENEAWFSYLFPLTLIKPPPPPPKTPPVVMPWGNSIFADCRVLPKPILEREETVEERMQRYMKMIGLYMKGTMKDWRPPPQQDLLVDEHHPKRLNNLDVRNIYCRKELRSTPAILHDVLYMSRVQIPVNARTKFYQSIPGKVGSLQMLCSLKKSKPMEIDNDDSVVSENIESLHKTSAVSNPNAPPV